MLVLSQDPLETQHWIVKSTNNLSECQLRQNMIETIDFEHYI